MQTRILQAGLRWLGFLFVCVVAGVIAYCTLHRPALVAAAVSLIAGLLYGGLWIWQPRAALRP